MFNRLKAIVSGSLTERVSN